MDSAAAGLEPSCAGCGARLAPALLACPSCSRLLHSEELKRLAAEAEVESAAGRISEALVRWRRALELLPPGTTQAARIAEVVTRLSRQVEQPAPPTQPPSGAAQKGLAGAGALGLMLWKFKFLLVMALTKGKLILLGLTKASTAFSMLLSFAMYGSLYGWPFAAGFVLSIYVHEMGHVLALRRYGVEATAPMFIPGFGAFIRAKMHLVDPRIDSRTGLAGPLYGLGAVGVAYAGFFLTGSHTLAAIGRTGALLNLFNLIPFWQLDGGRGFSALNRPQRWIAAGAVGAAWFFSEESLLALLLIGAVVQALAPPKTDEPDAVALAQYVGLVLALSLLSMRSVTGIG